MHQHLVRKGPIGSLRNGKATKQFSLSGQSGDVDTVTVTFWKKKLLLEGYESLTMMKLDGGFGQKGKSAKGIRKASKQRLMMFPC